MKNLSLLYSIVLFLFVSCTTDMENVNVENNKIENNNPVSETQRTRSFGPVEAAEESDNYCLTVKSKRKKPSDNLELISRIRSSNRYWLDIPVKIHTATTENAASNSEISNMAIEKLSIYINSNAWILFNLVDSDEMPSNFASISTSAGPSGYNHMVSTYGDEDVLNIYIVDKLLGSYGKAKALNIPSNHFIITYSLIQETYDNPSWGSEGSDVVLAHEVGHCLGLEHTFSTQYGPQIVNSPASGDGIADTPADNIDLETDENCIVINNTIADGNGDAYNPDTDLIMSYYRYQCINRFSDQQINIMIDHAFEYLDYWD